MSPARNRASGVRSSNGATATFSRRAGAACKAGPGSYLAIGLGAQAARAAARASIVALFMSPPSVPDAAAVPSGLVLVLLRGVLAQVLEVLLDLVQHARAGAVLRAVQGGVRHLLV